MGPALVRVAVPSRLELLLGGDLCDAGEAPDLHEARAAANARSARPAQHKWGSARPAVQGGERSLNSAAWGLQCPPT